VIYAGDGNAVRSVAATNAALIARFETLDIATWPSRLCNNLCSTSAGSSSRVTSSAPPTTGKTPLVPVQGLS